MKCNPHSFVNGKSTSSNILENIEINKSFIEGDHANIIHIPIFARYLILYLTIIYLLIKMLMRDISKKVNFLRYYLTEETMKVVIY